MKLRSKGFKSFVIMFFGGLLVFEQGESERVEIENWLIRIRSGG